LERSAVQPKLQAGGEVNTTVTFLKDEIMANSFNGSAKDGGKFT